ncbi:MAG: hypothetical protein FJY09_06410 [Chlorobi bacterium]|nr:hypothetical protein [Chlorobiota bacterium]
MLQNPLASAAAALGIAGGTALLAPVAAPTLHGLAGIAVVGFGVYASGSTLVNAANFLSETASGILAEGTSTAGLIKDTLLSKPKPLIPVKEIPFRW